MIVLGYVLSCLYGLLCLFLSKILYKAGVPQRYTRKIVHIAVGFEWVILYHTVGVGWHFLAVCLLFTALLYVSYKMDLMPMISSGSDNAPGTVYYGVSMSVLAVASMILEGFVLGFGVAVFCTSIGDGFAGVIGSSIKRCNPRIYKNKTLFGTLTAFAFSTVSVAVFSLVYGLELSFWKVFVIGLLAAGLELVADRGLDNILLPVGIASFTYAFLVYDGIGNYILPIVLTPFVIIFAKAPRVLLPVRA